MRHRSSTTSYGWVKLVKKTNPKTGRKHYSVIVDAYGYFGGYPNASNEAIVFIHNAWRNHFDPGHNRGKLSSWSWKFGNKEEAEQLITLALLKWGTKHVA